MRLSKIASALAATSMLVSAASAADLSLLYKAPRQGFSTDVYSNSGWFLTVESNVGVAQSQVNGTNFLATSLVGGGLVSDGAGVGGGFGYISYGGPTGWWMFRNDVTYQNIRGGNAVGSVSSNWSITQEACVGVSFFNMLANVLPSITQSFPTFNPVAPPGAVGTPRQCVGVVSDESEIGGQIGAASGQTWIWSPGVSAHALWEAGDASGKPTGGAWDLSALIEFPTKGATFGDVFASNGHPITLGPGANIGTTYKAGIAYHFSPFGFAASPPGK